MGDFFGTWKSGGTSLCDSLPPFLSPHPLSFPLSLSLLRPSLSLIPFLPLSLFLPLSYSLFSLLSPHFLSLSISSLQMINSKYKGI